MRLSFGKRAPVWAAAAGVLLGLAAPAGAAPPPVAYPGPCLPGPVIIRDGVPPTTPPPPTPPTTPTPTPTPSPDLSTAPEASPFSSAERFAALGGTTAAAADSAPGYIDFAVPLNTFRLRFDAGYDNNRPDRAEFFYPKCGCFRTAGVDPNAPGPPLAETKVDYQDVSVYLEGALSNRFSVFVEAPVRFLNPEQNANTAGFADMNAGFKAALVANPGQFLTFQFRTYIPTGDADRGLGTDHVSLEPGLLLYQELGERLFLLGELRDWIPVGGTDFQGNVLRYGAGVGFGAYQSSTLRVTPIVELVGWTVLNGKEFAFPENAILEAGGDTILNVKAGVRVGTSDFGGLYVGYGRALTGDVWYKDMLRVEYRLSF